MQAPIAPALVLDTNVVLDWLVFADARTAGLADAVTSGRVRWVVSLPMRSELARVLDRGIAARRGRDDAAVLAVFDRWALRLDDAAAAAPPGLRCDDPDDQMFIDLALQTRASALLSRDRAVLRLTRAAARRQLRITVPDHWAG